MATKTIVTKERLAYYDQKIKAEIAKKGDIKQVKIAGNTPISPDSNGVLTLPDNLVEGSFGGDSSLTYPMNLKYYYKDGTDANVRDTLVFGGDSTDSTLFHIKQNRYNVDDGLDQGTSDYVLPTQSYVDAKASALSGSKFQKVSAIPDAATATDGVIYLVPNTGSGNNVFDEYFRVNLGTESAPNYAMEKVGSTAIDLSGYVEETDLIEITTAEIDEFFTPAVTP